MAIDASAQGPRAGTREEATDPALQVTPAGVVLDIALDDGSEFHGRIAAVAGDDVVVCGIEGPCRHVTPARIVRAVPAAGRMVGGEFWPADPHPTRLFVSPTARSPRAGGLTISGFPGLEVGVGSRISVAGLVVPYPGLGECCGVVYWGAAKVQVVNRGATTAALGLIHGADSGTPAAGIVYAVTTRGSTDNAVTLGGGYRYRHDPTRTNGAVVILGAERRVSRRLKAMAEGVAAPGTLRGGLGVRWIARRFSADLGAGVFRDDGVEFDTPTGTYRCCASTRLGLVANLARTF